jgi:hypothetical protein
VLPSGEMDWHEVRCDWRESCVLADKSREVWSKRSDILFVKCSLDVFGWSRLHNVVSDVLWRKVSCVTPMIDQIVEIVESLLIFSEGVDTVTWNRKWCRWWGFRRSDKWGGNCRSLWG